MYNLDAAVNKNCRIMMLDLTQLFCAYLRKQAEHSNSGLDISVFINPDLNLHANTTFHQDAVINESP